MKSNLTKSEFKQRLAELTSVERPFYFITPYNFSGKPFCGKFTDSSFDLTRNSIWPSVSAIRIKGEYVRIGNDTTEVFYEVGLAKPLRFFILLFFGATLAGMNMVLIAMGGEGKVILTFSGFWIFAGLWGMVLNWIITKIVNQRFQVEFEMVVLE